MTRIPVRALTLGVADPHPLSPQVLQKAASALHHATAGVTEAGYEVQTERLSTRPLLSDLSDWHPAALVRYAAELQEALDNLAVPFCSLGPALPPDAGPERTELLADLIAGRPALNASVMVATAEGGLDMGAARAAARIMKRLAEETEEGFGNFNFAALACVGPGGPFLPAAYHAVGAPANLTVALQGSGIVAEALRGGAALPDVTERIKDKLTEHAGPIVALVAAQAAEHGLDFGGIDLSPAPDGEDSIVMAMELAGHGPLGGPGTLALAAALTAGVQGTSLPTCGYCGLMLPHAAPDGRCGPGPALGGGVVRPRPVAGLFGRVRHRPGHHPPGRRLLHRGPGRHHLRRGQPGPPPAQAAVGPAPAGTGQGRRRSYRILVPVLGEHGDQAAALTAIRLST